MTHCALCQSKGGVHSVDNQHRQNGVALGDRPLTSTPTASQRSLVSHTDHPMPPSNNAHRWSVAPRTLQPSLSYFPLCHSPPRHRPATVCRRITSHEPQRNSEQERFSAPLAPEVIARLAPISSPWPSRSWIDLAGSCTGWTLPGRRSQGVEPTIAAGTASR